MALLYELMIRAMTHLSDMASIRGDVERATALLERYTESLSYKLLHF